MPLFLDFKGCFRSQTGPLLPPSALNSSASIPYLLSFAIPFFRGPALAVSWLYVWKLSKGTFVNLRSIHTNLSNFNWFTAYNPSAPFTFANIIFLYIFTHVVTLFWTFCKIWSICFNHFYSLQGRHGNFTWREKRTVYFDPLIIKDSRWR